MSTQVQILLEESDLACPLCFDLLDMPTTLRCGHTGCLECFQRALDNSSCCPVCRSPVHIIGSLSTNFVLDDLVKKHFPARANERRQETQLHESWMPLFVLDTTLLPGEAMSIHVYEPRYKLMIRRCMLGSGTFGVLLNGANVGISVKMLVSRPLDCGRFFLRIEGARKFRIQEFKAMDDYQIGRIEWIDDADKENETDPQLKSLCQSLQQESTINLTYENIPQEPKQFAEWFAKQLHLRPDQKQFLLETESLKTKLTKLREFNEEQQYEWIKSIASQKWILFIILIIVYTSS